MSAPLQAEEFIAAIWQERRRYVLEGKIKQPRPWRFALSDGKVSRPALVEYVKTRCYFLANINRKDAQVIANCPISDARRLKTLYKNYVIDALPLKPYPMEEALQGEVENLTATVPELRGKRAADFVDKSLLTDLEREGFFS